MRLLISTYIKLGLWDLIGAHHDVRDLTVCRYFIPIKEREREGFRVSTGTNLIIYNKYGL